MDPNVPSPARLQQVQVRYRDPAALQGLDLQVRAGQVRALLGGDATGKSSAVSTLQGMRLSSDPHPLPHGRVPAGWGKQRVASCTRPAELS